MPTDTRKFLHWPLGFVSDRLIAPGETMEIAMWPEQPFRGEKLLVHDSIARYFDLMDVRIGNRSVFLNIEPVAAETFSSPDSDDENKVIDCPVSKPGQRVKLWVRNNSTKFGIRFHATLLGSVPRGGPDRFEGDGLEGRLPSHVLDLTDELLRKPNPKRPLGFTTADPIEPGQTVEILSSPQMPFRAEQLFVPAFVAEHFDVKDVRIAGSSLLENGKLTVAGGLLAKVSENIAMIVHNKSPNVSARFQATLLGRVPEHKLTSEGAEFDAVN